MNKSLLCLICVFLFFGLSSKAQTYYVSPVGNNSNTGQSVAQAFATIQQAYNVSNGGATIYVVQGTYHEHIYVQGIAGSSTNPILLKNYNGGLVILDGDSTQTLATNAIINFDDVDNAIIDGISFTNATNSNAKGVFIHNKSKNITVKNCKFSKINFSSNPLAVPTSTGSDNSNPLVVWGDNVVPITHITIQNVEVFNCNTGFSESITMNGNVDGFLIEECYVHDVKNIGIDVAGHYGVCSDPALDQVRNGTIRKNRTDKCSFYNTVSSAGAIYVDGAKNVIVENNRAYGGQVGISVGCEIPFHTADSITVRNNLVYNNSRTGIEIGGWSYYNNLSGKVTNSTVVGNTCFKNNTDTSIWAGELIASNNDNLNVHSNIFYASNYHNVLINYLPHNGSNNHFNYNDYYTPSASYVINYDTIGYSSLADLQTYTGNDTNSIFANPMLIDPNNLNFHLSTNSPAINKGNPSYLSSNLEKDMDNEVRKNGVIDCGSDESYFVSVSTTPNYNPVGGDTSGYTQGTFNVSDAGVANYSIPLVITPGRNNIQPSIAISYSSQNGNGLLGQGWLLQGLSSISRTSQTKAQDGVSVPVNFTSTDRFALDGERLVNIDTVSIYGGNGTEYRTEQNSFAQIFSIGTNPSYSNTPDHFIIKTKSGEIWEYGNTPDSKINVQGSNTLFWLASKVSDTKGNFYSFTYFKDSITGEYYPIRIDYTGNSNSFLPPFASVQFNYENRMDSATTYLNGVSISNNKKRLKSVTNYYGSTLVRTYNLGYQSSLSNLSQLVSIQECGSDGKCHTPTTISWNNSITPTFTNTNVNNIPQSNTNEARHSIDINGDGVQDIVRIIKGGNPSIECYVSNKNSSSLSLVNVPIVPNITITSKYNFGDVNGDGKIDILVFDSISGSSNLYVNTSFGGGQVTFNNNNPYIASSLLTGSKSVLFSDLNGDGRSDILTFDYSTGNNYWMISNSIGNNFVNFELNGVNNFFTNLISDLTLFQGNYQPYILDFNNDGKSDILFWNPSNGATKLYRNAPSPYPLSLALDTTNLILPSLITNTNGTLKIQDVNGDGLQDILFYVQSSGTNTWFVNHGRNQFINVTPTPSNLSSLISGGTLLLQVDINSDGYSDLIWIDKATGQNKWFLNDGKLNFSQLATNIINPTWLNGYEIEGIGNFSSKSNFDFFVFNNSLSPKGRIILGDGNQNNLVSQIQNGNGQVIQINYDYLTYDSVYAKQDSSIYPLLDYQATQAVVSKWFIKNGVGSFSETDYKYYGAKINMEGRGFRGFSRIDQKDVNTGILKTRYFLNDSTSWKYINSQLIRETTKLANGTITSDITYTNDIKTFYNGKCHFSYVKYEKAKNYELDGTFVDSTVTHTEYDNFGNALTVVVNKGDGMIDSAVNEYVNETAGTWLIGRLTKSHLYQLKTGYPTQVHASAFTYYMGDATGLLQSEITEPDSSNQVKTVKTYIYDANGNILLTTLQAWNGTTVETRTTSTTYDGDYRFVTSFTNAAGQTSFQTTEPLLGKVTSQTDLNGLKTFRQYDGFGRETMVYYPDGNWSSTDYRKCNGVFPNSPALAVHLIYKESSVSPPQISYLDLLNRVIRTEKSGFNGTKIFKDDIYNNLGLLTDESIPYYQGGAIIYTHSNYDIKGRKVEIIEPGNRVDSVIYHGRTTVTRNSLGHHNTIIIDANGKTIKVTDNQGNNLFHEYDAGGNLIKTTDPVGNNWTWEYDIHRNITKSFDPDMGTKKFVTNGFKEVVKHTDNMNHIQTMKYDSLGRMVMLQEPEGITTWIYDNKPNGIGLIGTEINYDGDSIVHVYDSFSRPINRKEYRNGKLYNIQTNYDSLSRIQSIIYPKGFGLKYEYNSNGYLYRVKNNASGSVLWKANTLNAKDEITQQQYGNNAIIQKTYNDYTDFLTSITTSISSTTIQDFTYTYNNIGSPTSRQDNVINKQEVFEYDDLNRLTKTHVIGLDTVVMSYNAIGNMLSKSDVGTFSYGGINTNPHQIVQINNLANACIPSLLINTTYFTFDKVKEITKGDTVVKIEYSVDRLRKSKKMYIAGNLVRTKIYIGGIYEEEVINGDTIRTNFITSPDGTIGSYVTHTNTTPSKLSYFHKDNLGSIVMVTNSSGVVEAKFSFDAWGKRRNSDWSALLTDTTGLASDRGFTGHEHYDLFDIVDMNGRIYDPVLAHFLTADPIVQQPNNLQCYNRYSYCINNPLAYTDPSGYSWFSKVFKKAAKWVGKNWKTIVTTAVAITVGYFTLGTGAGLFETMLSGAASGFASSTVGTLLAGGNLGDALRAGIKGAVVSGLTAGGTFQVAEWFPSQLSNNLHATDGSNVFEKMIAHGLVQGTASVANGGKFLNGFATGAVTTFSSQWTGDLKNDYSKIAAAAVVGGTTSSITGGSFSNGAISGAFIEMYNGLQEYYGEEFREAFNKTAGINQQFSYGGAALALYLDHPELAKGFMAYENYFGTRMAMGMVAGDLIAHDWVNAGFDLAITFTPGGYRLVPIAGKLAYNNWDQISNKDFQMPYSNGFNGYNCAKTGLMCNTK
ncbi:MAG: VCBS repeat-containing protein [Chitinophagaceae bacterium]|nr:VCBS repeat-containing protein [Chitinophagaceae bacterium]